MTSKYETIYSRFLSRITDYEFLGLKEDVIYGMMNNWMRSAFAKPYVRRLFSTLTLDDEILEFDFVLKNPIDDESDEEFVIEIISNGMVIEWLEPKVKSTLNISQMFAGKEQKFYAQANHLSELKDMLETEKTNLRKMIRDRGYANNSYINT